MEENGGFSATTIEKVGTAPWWLEAEVRERVVKGDVIDSRRGLLTR